MKLLYGVTGIGYGHTYRQLPILEHFAAQGARIVVFAYGRSLEVLGKIFAGRDNVSVLEVAVPFWSGGPEGLDFSAAMNHPDNSGRDFFRTNITALAQAQQLIGQPDLVITDMEPTAAQYAYATGAPLVTIDQQSKFLFGDFPVELAGHTCRDEQARIRMFFPRADARLVCTFFSFAVRRDPAFDAERIKFFAPTLTGRITGLDRRPQTDGRSILVYVSSARPFGQSAEEIAALLKTRDDTQFHLFVDAADAERLSRTASANVRVHRHGDDNFLDVLRTCNGIVCTAGHSLLSEAMYLGIPVYAMPVEPYEQHLNAKTIADNGFGVQCPKIDADVLDRFISQLPHFAARIRNDREVLLRGAGQDGIIPYLENRFLA